MVKQNFSSQRFDKDHFILDFFDNQFRSIQISVFSETRNMYLADHGEMTLNENLLNVTLEYPGRPITSKMVLDFSDAFLYTLSMLSKYAPFQIYVYLDGKKQDRYLVVSNPRFPSVNNSSDMSNGVGVLSFYDGTYTHNKAKAENNELLADGFDIGSRELSQSGSNMSADKNAEIACVGIEEKLEQNSAAAENRAESTDLGDSRDSGRDRGESISLENDSRFDTSFSSEDYNYTPPNFYKIVAPLLIVAVVFISIFFIILIFFDAR